MPLFESFEEWVARCLRKRAYNSGPESYMSPCYECNFEFMLGAHYVSVYELSTRIVFKSGAPCEFYPYHFYTLNICYNCIHSNAFQTIKDRALPIINAHNEHNKNVETAVKESEWIPQWSEIPGLIREYCMVKEVDFT
jgi:hypothetical protein